jgi:hypothetical protein
MVIGNQLIKITGNILPKPSVSFKGCTIEVSFSFCLLSRIQLKVSQPKDGSWNVKDQKLANPKPMIHWAILNFCATEADVDHLVNQLGMRCNALGQ